MSGTEPSKKEIDKRNCGDRGGLYLFAPLVTVQ